MPELAPSLDATPDTAPPPIDNESSIMADIDSLFAPAEEKSPEVKPGDTAKPAEKAKPEDVKPPGEKPPEVKPKPASEKPAAEKPPEATSGSAKDLRKMIENLQRENAELKLTRTPPAAKPDPNAPDPKILGEQLTSAQKELQRLQDEIRYVNYEQSPEYNEKYKVPSEKAFNAAYADISELKVEENGETRAATNNDFLRLLKLPLGDATTAARQMFGDAAPEMMAHRRKIIDLNNARAEAVKEYRDKGAQRESAAKQEQSAREQHFHSEYKRITDETAKKYPQFFGPEEGDEKGNELLKSGFDFIDRINSDKTLTPEQQLAMRSQVKLRAAAYTRELHRSLQLRNRVADLEKELEAFKKSEPGIKGGGGSTAPKTETTWQDEIDALARKSG